MILVPVFMKLVPFSLITIFCTFALVTLCGCTTLQNRRDLYFPEKVEGPYTRILQHRLATPSPTPVRFPTVTGVTGSGKNVIKPQG